MQDYLNLENTPIEEKCVQVSRDKDYYMAMRAECRAFKHQLERMFPDMHGAYLTIKSFPHDFGTYCEVCVVYNDENEEAMGFACELESNLPETWDDEAREELKQIPDYEDLIH